MSQQIPPFNGINISYTCQCCGDPHAGQPVRAPAGIMLGKVMMEKYVCPGCQADHHKNLKKGFWGADKVTVKPGECPGCNHNLKDGRSYPAHLDLNPDGTWTMVRLCTPCFGEYKAVCVENMKS